MTGLRGLLRLGSVAGPPPAGVRVLTDADAAAADALHDRCSAADLGAASPHPGDALLAVGVVAGDRLVGVAAAVQPPAGPPEVSVLVDPAYRRQGLAARAEQGLIAAAAGRWVWLQHRTISQDQGSQRLAARCGFALLTREHLVRPG
jgi:RimJ/RimL family protein N-acetyltransferase